MIHKSNEIPANGLNGNLGIYRASFIDEEIDGRLNGGVAVCSGLRSSYGASLAESLARGLALAWPGKVWSGASWPVRYGSVQWQSLVYRH